MFLYPGGGELQGIVKRKGEEMEKQVVGSIRTEKGTDFFDYVVTISTTSDVGGRFYLGFEDGISIGINLHDLMEFIEESIRL